MKIAIVSPSFGVFGGLEGFVCALASELQTHPELSVTLCFKKTKDFVMDPLLEATAAKTGARVVFAERASVTLFNVIREADIVHGQNPCIDVAVLAKLLGKPLVLTIHNRRLGWLHPREILRAVAYRLADRRWYNSDFVWDTWEPRGRLANSARLPVVSNLPSGKIPIPRRKGFVFIARWIPNKGIDTLVEAYARARIDRDAWPLVLIGHGPLRPVIESRIRALNLSGIQMTGQVDEPTRNDLIRHARWMVTPPNTKEDLGLTPLESRHVGVPCIITRDGGLPEAGGRYALSCEPGDAEGLKSLLEQAASMPAEEYEKLCEATYNELLNYLQPLSLYLDRYREVCAK